MGIALLPLAIVGPSTLLWLTFSCLLLHAFLAATQDVAIDALCISVIPSGERGRANGWMQAGMLAGRALFGGGTLVLMTSLGPRWGVSLLIGVIWAVALVVARSHVLRADETVVADRPLGVATVIAAFRTLLRHRQVWYALGFGLTAGAVFEGLGSVAGPFLIDTGHTPEAAGSFFALPAIVGMVAGALLGGVISDRIGSGQAALFSFVALFVLVISFSIALLADVVPPGGMIVPLSFVYLGIGLFTASSYALFMDASVHELRATSFSAYMGSTNLCESWSAFAVGRLVPPTGYGGAFGVMAILALGSLFFLRKLRSAPGINQL